jgi:hypothetical protein
MMPILVQRELDKSLLRLKDSLVFGKEVFLGQLPALKMSHEKLCATSPPSAERCSCPE